MEGASGSAAALSGKAEDYNNQVCRERQSYIVCVYIVNLLCSSNEKSAA